jgi:hypothetical protein
MKKLQEVTLKGYWNNTLVTAENLVNDDKRVEKKWNKCELFIGSRVSELCAMNLCENGMKILVLHLVRHSFQLLEPAATEHFFYRHYFRSILFGLIIIFEPVVIVRILPSIIRFNTRFSKRWVASYKKKWKKRKNVEVIIIVFEEIEWRLSNVSETVLFYLTK